jgi:hypothetical protein
MIKSKNLPVTLPVSKRVESTTIWEWFFYMVYMMQLVDIFHDKHLNKHDIEVLVFLLFIIIWIFLNKIHSITNDLMIFFESFNSSQASQICGVENCVGSYVCEP